MMRKPASPIISEIEQSHKQQQQQHPFWDEEIKDLRDIVPESQDIDQIPDGLSGDGEITPTSTINFLDDLDQEQYSSTSRNFPDDELIYSSSAEANNAISYRRKKMILTDFSDNKNNERHFLKTSGTKRKCSESSSSGASKCMKQLPRKSRVLKRNKEGNTKLHWKISIQDEDTDRYIEECDIRELNAVNHEGQTPLHIAVYLGASSTIEKIIEKRLVDIERYDSNVNTPLHLACMKPIEPDALEIAKMLLTKCTASSSIVNSKNEDGLTPLHLAAQRNYLELIKLLRLKGADINIQDDKTGKTSLMFLAENDLEGKTIRYVVEYFDADVSRFSYCESTALHFACGRDNINAVRILLENGAKIGVKNIQKKSEKELASDIEIKKMLEKESRRQKRLQSIELRRSQETAEYDDTLLSENDSRTADDN